MRGQQPPSSLPAATNSTTSRGIALSIALVVAIIGFMIPALTPAPNMSQASGQFLLFYHPQSGFSLNSSQNLSWPNPGEVRFEWEPGANQFTQSATLSVYCLANGSRLYSAHSYSGEGAFHADEGKVYEFGLSNSPWASFEVWWTETYVTHSSGPRF